MDLSVNRIGRIFQTYRAQERIADLNRQAHLRTVQSPRDRVSISAEARARADAQAAARLRPPRVPFTPGPPPEPAAAPEPAAPPPPPADSAAPEFTPLFET